MLKLNAAKPAMTEEEILKAIEHLPEPQTIDGVVKIFYKPLEIAEIAVGTYHEHGIWTGFPNERKLVYIGGLVKKEKEVFLSLNEKIDLTDKHGYMITNVLTPITSLASYKTLLKLE